MADEPVDFAADLEAAITAFEAEATRFRRWRGVLVPIVDREDRMTQLAARRLYYTLTPEHEVVPTDDIHVWGRFTDDDDAVRVAATDVGETWVSTVFLGIDHNWTGTGPPILFETMIFDHAQPPGELDQWTDRYATWGEAEAGHARVVTALQEGRNPDD